MTKYDLHALHRWTHIIGDVLGGTGTTLIEAGLDLTMSSLDACANSTPQQHIELMSDLRTALPEVERNLTLLLTRLGLGKRSLADLSANIALLDAQAAKTIASLQIELAQSDDAEPAVGVSYVTEDDLIRALFGDADVRVVAAPLRLDFHG